MPTRTSSDQGEPSRSGGHAVASMMPMPPGPTDPTGAAFAAIRMADQDSRSPEMQSTGPHRSDLQRSLEEFASLFPETWSDTPWDGDQVTKVRKKIFAFYGSAGSPGLTVKLPDSADHALTFPGAEPTGYGLGRHGWVSIPIGHVADEDAEVLFDFVEESYRAVAPKTLVTELDRQLDG